MMYSSLAAPDDPPRVFSAAAYRRHAAHPADHLAASHRMYPADAAQWSSAQRRAIAAFLETFTPDWRLPEGQFSPWHFMAVSRLFDGHGVRPVVLVEPAPAYHVGGPDVVLAEAMKRTASR
ncbi:MAG: hypothetical protein ACT4QD_20100 [Acidobacteriota bacterium]